MTVQGLIDMLQDLIAHGQNPDAVVMTWDPDLDVGITLGGWGPVTGATFTRDEVRLYTDED